MYISGYGYVGEASSPVGAFTSVSIAHADFDWLHITNEPLTSNGTRYVESYGTGTKGLPDWGEYTMLSTNFEDSYESSGAMKFVNEMSDILIRRRESDSSPWLTIARRKITKASDFFIDFQDFLCANDAKYQYIAVPIINGQETEYLTGNMTEYVTATLEGLYISDQHTMYGTPFDPSVTRQRNRESNVITTLGNRYATVVSNGEINYDSGTVSGLFVEYDAASHYMDLENNFGYRNDMMDFLTNGEPKILRSYDGMMKMIQVDGNIQEDKQDSYLITHMSFDWVEIGDATDYQSLLDNGFIDLS